MTDTGDYETHLTVHLPNTEDLPRLQEWSSERGLKCVHIVLDRGDSVSQPMLTTHSKGRFSDQLVQASRLAYLLSGAGFPASRIKIEASPDNPEVPHTVGEAVLLPKTRYFEHHIKLLLPRGTDTTTLANIAQANGAHLSRNAFKQRDDGFQERFVTQRCVSVPSSIARQQLNTLLQALASLGHPILDVEEEFVVYDTNLELDAGWITLQENRRNENELSKSLSNSGEERKTVGPDGDL